jgi:site-specific DNA-cytosine methylase
MSVTLRRYGALHSAATIRRVLMAAKTTDVTERESRASLRVTTLYARSDRRGRGRPPASYAAVSLFSGCGGMDLGAEMTGSVKTVWAVDNDPWAVETYRRNLGSHAWLADIRETDFIDVPCDVLLAGPPCQDFSSLWNHDGAKTARGNLFREVARFLDQRQPKAFVLGNVPGLLSANHGEAWLLIAPGANYTTIPADHPLAVKGLISHVYRRLDPERPSYTMIAGGGGGTHGYHHIEPRRLSNRERARLQSFPDDFVFEGGSGRSNYPRVRKQVGNAVPPEGARVIVQALVDTLRAAKVPGTPSRAIAEARKTAARGDGASA